MCSPYDYLEEEKKDKVEIQKLNLIRPFLKKISILPSVQTRSLKVAQRSTKKSLKSSKKKPFPHRMKIDGSSYLFYFVLIIFLTLEFFPLTNSAVIQTKRHPNQKFVLMTPSILSLKNDNHIYNSENNQIITRQQQLNNNKEDDFMRKNSVPTSLPLHIDTQHPLRLETTIMGEEMNCTRATILDFPVDLISELPHGAMLVHIIISLYIFYAIAYLCDAFFVPSIELICKVLHVPADIGGATFMAIATSSPEFFTNVIGTFVTNGDIGVGSVVGSVVFNLLAIISWCGLAAKVELKLDWWPLTRDIFFYVLSVVFLIGILWDGLVHWYEALVLVLCYCGYIAVICNNKKVEETLENWMRGKSMKSPPIPSQERLRELLICSLSYDGFKSNESTPLLSNKSGQYKFQPQSTAGMEGSRNNLQRACGEDSLSKNSINQIKSLPENQQHQHDNPVLSKDHVHDHVESGLFELPRGQSCLKWFEWIAGWPVRFVLHLTIPDCRLLAYTNWYPLTFCICIVYMAIFSYIITWMMTVVGQTLGITDSIMGLSFIAMGTSLPEAVSSIIVARQGLGTMSVSNSVGSNTFNILLCLGLPWLLRNLMLTLSGAVDTSIPMTTGGFGYVSIFLLASALLLYGLIVWNNYLLDFKIGMFALLMYILFLILASLLELNVFFPVNLPTCKIN